MDEWYCSGESSPRMNSPLSALKRENWAPSPPSCVLHMWGCMHAAVGACWRKGSACVCKQKDCISLFAYPDAFKARSGAGGKEGS
eukprot:1148435-Pelagomonas_calceolata.AAC.6